MARRPYVPSGNADAGAVPVIAALAIASGLAAGALLGFVSQWFSLLLIFPLVLGLVVGGVGAAQVKSRHVRMPMAMLGIALAGGLVGELALHAVKYWNVRRSIARDLESDQRFSAYVAEHGLSQSIDESLAGEGQSPVLGYLEGMAKAGVSITKAGHSGGSKPTLTGLGVYALWLVNLLIVCGVAAMMMVSEARKPFCENCNDWYGWHDTLAKGAGDSATVKQLIAKLENQQLADAARSLGTSDGSTASFLALQTCKTCNVHEPLITLTLMNGLKGKKPVEKVVYKSLISPSEASALRESVKA